MNEAAHQAVHGETFFELAQWLARVQQYSATHPACAQLGERTQRALTRSLAIESPLVVEVSKDDMSIGEVPITSLAVRSRLAPHLHERGVALLRFSHGTSVAELTAFIELLTLPVQSTFDRGGLRDLATERGIERIQIEEIAHDISADERAAQRTRVRLRTRFSDVLRDLLAQRSIQGLTGDELLELLDHPDVAVTILEEDPLGIAESLAGLCLMVRDEEQRTGEVLYPKLRVIMLALTPHSHERVLLGLPTLVGEFRGALAWALDGLDEGELARVALAAFRPHAADLEVPLYALSVAAPHDGRRMSTLRRLSLHFYDLPSDDLSAAELVAACALHDGEVDSYLRERECLSPHALRVLGGRASFTSKMESLKPPPAAEEAVAPEASASHPGNDRAADNRRVMSELVKMASRTRRFERLCEKLPETATTLARAGSTASVLGLLDGLRSVPRAESKELALQTLRAVVTSGVAAQLLADADARSATIDGASLEEVGETVKLLASFVPDVVFEQLELSESRKMRRILLEALSVAGPGVLPLVRRKLLSDSWFVVRNALVLLTRVGGATRDLTAVAGHANEKVRLEVLRAVRALPLDRTAMEIIASYLTDPVPDIRQPATMMLRGDLLSVDAIARLESIVLSEEHPEPLRQRVIDALGRCALDAAATALFTLLQPRGLLDLGSLRDHVAMALRRSPAPLAPGYFAEGLKSPAWRVRKACERAAGARP